MTYDFRTLSHPDFEDLVRDLVGKHFGVTFEAFSAGPDQGIDSRHSKADVTTVAKEPPPLLSKTASYRVSNRLSNRK